MTNIINLTKIYFKQLIIQTFSIKSNNKKNKNAFLLTALLFAIIMGSVAYMLFNFSSMLAELNLQQNIMFLGLVYASFLTLFFLIYETQGYFFKNKDFEMLSSMPIKTSEIIISKFISVLLTSYVYEILFLIPTSIIYFVSVDFSALSLLYILIGMIFFPIIYIFIGSGVGAVINLITSKMKHKNLFNSIFMVVFVLAIVCLFSFSGNNMMVSVFGNGIPLYLKIIFPSAFFLFDAIITHSFLSLLWLILINIASVFLTVLVISLSYKKVNTSYKQNNASVSKKPLSFEKKSVFSTLFKNEIKRWGSIPVYVINSIIGPIMTIAMSVMFASMFRGQSLGMASESVGVMIILVFCMVSGLSNTTSASISLEGKNIYIVKSLPISFNQFIMPKISLNLMLSLPMVLVSSIIVSIFLSFSWLMTIAVILVPMLSCLVFSLFGILINLYLPKLDWTSEIQVVKQSSSVFINMFTPMLIMGALAALYFGLLAEVLSYVWFLLILVVILIVALITIITLLHKSGKKLYEKL